MGTNRGVRATVGKNRNLAICALVAVVLTACSHRPPNREVRANPPAPGAPSGTVDEPPFIPSPGDTTGNVVLYPPETRSGIAVIDRVIDVVIKRDLQTLSTGIQMTEVKCSRSVGIPCLNGKPEGTTVHVFPRLTCNLLWLYSEEQVQDMIKREFAAPLRLVAIYEEDPDRWEFPAKFVLVFAKDSTGTESTRGLYLDESGSVTGVRLGCLEPRSAIPPNYPVKVILPIKES